ncbi:MAG: trypsin-like peptidase domain-containing protein [Planctomycetota bacterium]|jgi:S1-C subfamily serine protease/Tfp pilus assembly protein PilF
MKTTRIGYGLQKMARTAALGAVILTGILGGAVSLSAQETPGKPLSFNDLKVLLEVGYDEAKILDAVDRASGLSVTTNQMEHLRALGATPRLIVAIRAKRTRSGDSLIDQVCSWKTKGIDTQEIILRVLRHGRHADLSVAQIQRLSKAGISTEVIKALAGRFVFKGYRRYTDPLGMLSLQHPAGWNVHEWHTGNGYQILFTPQHGVQRLNEFHTGLQIQVSYVGPYSDVRRMDVLEHHRRSLPGLLQQNRCFQLKVTANAQSAMLAGRPAVRQPFAVRMQGRQCREVLLRCKAEDLSYFIEFVTPEADFDAMHKEIGEKMLATFRPLPNEVVHGRRAQPLAPAKVLQRYRSSVVMVKARFEGGAGGSGSGFLVREDGYVLTNAHVVAKNFSKALLGDLGPRNLARQITVVLEMEESGDDDAPDSRRYVRRELPARLVDVICGHKPQLDLALLKLPRGRKPYPVIPMTRVDGKLVREGDPIIAVGFPKPSSFGKGNMFLTQGHVTTIKRLQRSFGKSSYHILDDLLTDATIASGNSGGPCISLVTGGVIGLNTYIPLDHQGRRHAYAGVCLIDYALQHFPQLRWYPKYKRMNAEQHLELGGMLLAIGNVRSARKEFELAIRDEESLSFEQQARLCWSMALLESREGNDEGFRKWRRQCLARDRNFLDAAASNAIDLAYGRKFGDAIAVAERLQREHPDNWYPIYVTARIHRIAGRHQEALRQLQAAEQAAGGFEPAISVLRGRVYVDAKKHEAAHKELQLVLKRHPDCVDARLAIADSLARRGDTAGADMEYRRAVDTHGNHAHVHATHGRFLRDRMKRDKDALDAMYRASVIAIQRNENASSTIIEACKLATKVQGERQTGIVLAQVLHSRWPARRLQAHALLADLWASLKVANLATIHGRCAGRNTKMLPLLKQADVVLMGRTGYAPGLTQDVFRRSSLDFTVDGKTLKALAGAGMSSSTLRLVLLKSIVDQMSGSSALGRAVDVKLTGKVQASGKYPWVICSFQNKSGLPLAKLMVRKTYYDKNKKVLWRSEGPLVTRDPVLRPGQTKTLQFQFNSWKTLQKKGIRDRVKSFGVQVVSARSADFLDRIKVVGKRTGSGFEFTVVNPTVFTVGKMTLRCDYQWRSGRPIANSKGLPIAAYTDVPSVVVGPGKQSGRRILKSWGTVSHARKLGGVITEGQQVLFQVHVWNAQLGLK